MVAVEPSPVCRLMRTRGVERACLAQRHSISSCVVKHTRNNAMHSYSPHIHTCMSPSHQERQLVQPEHDLTSSQVHAMAQVVAAKPAKKRITPIPIDRNSAGTFGSTAAHAFGAPFGYAAQTAPAGTLGSDAAAPSAGQEAQHAQHHEPDEDSPCVQTPGRRMRVRITPGGDGCFMLDYRQVRPMVVVGHDLGIVACSRQRLGFGSTAACMLVCCWQCISPACFFKPAARQGEQGGRCCCSKEQCER